MNLEEAILTRRSVRKYAEGEIPQKDIEKILKAAMMCPSACNRRAYEFAVVRSREKLEEIADNFKGVEKSFAIQAGRELRIVVIPEAVTDEDMTLLAREISKKIEEELEYPGQIKVNLIRETRAVDYAK